MMGTRCLEPQLTPRGSWLLLKGNHHVLHLIHLGGVYSQLKEIRPPSEPIVNWRSIGVVALFEEDECAT